MNKHRYLVGFKGDGNVTYGKDWKHSINFQQGGSQWADPMTLLQAKRKKAQIQKVNSPKVSVVIFELKPTKH